MKQMRPGGHRHVPRAEADAVPPVHPCTKGLFSLERWSSGPARGSRRRGNAQPWGYASPTAPSPAHTGVQPGPARPAPARPAEQRRPRRWARPRGSATPGRGSLGAGACGRTERGWGVPRYLGVAAPKENPPPPPPPAPAAAAAAEPKVPVPKEKPADIAAAVGTAGERGWKAAAAAASSGAAAAASAPHPARRQLRTERRQ